MKKPTLNLTVKAMRELTAEETGSISGGAVVIRKGPAPAPGGTDGLSCLRNTFNSSINVASYSTSTW